ncbi:unnamed protein product [Spodoptera littoralis]|uniref:Uncharacterized protein n=1 Tax=Spodoptera littoralis TaxID=7109 RepID=A0A9P0N653_SPOLI|nr:unnamed protein product [Spodoptera littoralis]CAH1641251.1 unnamed protein product [Spodoptera littoralis]
MWWIVFWCLLSFNGHISSQPLDAKDNVRQTRQLDFGECCPCPGAGQVGQGFEAQSPSFSSYDGPYSRAREVDDCPCRARSSDSDGASSAFFPTAVRPDGHAVRSSETKEDPKPLLHPEVDLASSVLETLREATDEEYKEALARDAARSMGKSADEAFFGDTIPDASTGNLVTIIMNPKYSEDDIVPQESHLQETRCVHGPLGSARSSPVQLRTATKPPNLLHELFGLPQVDQLDDMDSGVGASNIEERVVKIDEDQALSKTKIGLRKYAPLLKPNTSIKDMSTNLKSNVGDMGIGSKVPNLKLPMTTLKDLLNQKFLEDEEKISSLPSIPKLRLNNSLLKPKPDLIEDMSVSPNDIQEQAIRNFFEAKSHLDNIFQNAHTRPLSLNNLLKLKDVEFVPLEDLVKTRAETPKLSIPQLNLPGIFDKEQRAAKLSIDEKAPVNLIQSTRTIGNLPIFGKNEMMDAEVSPSNMIEQVSNTDCNEESAKSAETDNGLTDDDNSGHEGEISTEIIDSESSPDTTQSVIVDSSNNMVDIESNELAQTTDDCNMNASLMTEFPIQPTERSSDGEDTEKGNRDEIELDNSEDNTTQEDSEPKNVTNDENCADNANDMDSLTDSSSNINNVVQPDDLGFRHDRTSENNNDITEESCSQEQSFNENVKPTGVNQPTKLIRPLALDKSSLSSIRENIKNRFENIKNTKAIPKTAKIYEKPIPINVVEEEQEVPTIVDNQQDSDCQDEHTLQVTTMKSVICDDEPKANDNSANKVSMQDLQKISDSMLQREEQERESKAACDELSPVGMESKMSTEEQSEENQKDSDASANIQKIVIMDPRQFDNGDESDGDSKISCPSRPTLSKQAEEVDDASGSASEVVASIMPQNNVVRPPPLFNKVVQPDLDLFNLPVPDLKNLVKIEPIPTLDDIKTGLNNLLGRRAGEAVELSRPVVDSRIGTPNILQQTMSADASTKRFRTKLPPLGLEDVDLDILPKLPKLELPNKNKLLLPDLRMKPLKLQSALNDKGILTGRKNPLDIFPNLETPGGRIKSLGRKAVKTLRKPDVLRSSLVPTKGIDELTEDLNSHAKHTLRHMQKTLQSTLREQTKIPTKLQSNDLLEAIARNHEDVSDKIKALHMDFNDRLETMRNNLFDNSLFESRTPELFSSLSSNIKERKSSLKTAQPKSVTSRMRDAKKSKTRRPDQQKPSGARLSSQSYENKFRMPAAASVIVPKTLKVPTLERTLPMKRPELFKQIPIVIPTTEDEVSRVASWKKESEKLNKNIKLTKSINPFKDSKIEVTFSTTPRPAMPRAQYRKLTLPSSHSDRNMRRFGVLDNSGSPSEMRSAVVASPMSSQDYKLGDKPVDSGNGPKSLTRQQKVTGKGGRLGNTQSKMSTDLESWPKASESAFLSKVKEAVKARLSKTPAIKKSENTEVVNTNTDMVRAASENVDMVESKVLKENVSYKCTMVCTKE